MAKRRWPKLRRSCPAGAPSCCSGDTCSSFDVACRAEDRCRGSRGRQLDCKGGAVARCALDANLSAVQLDDAARNRKAQPHIADIAGLAAVDAIVTIENAAQLVVKYPLSRVAHLELDPVAGRMNAYTDLPAGRRIPHRVLD